MVRNAARHSITRAPPGELSYAGSGPLVCAANRSVSRLLATVRQNEPIAWGATHGLPGSRWSPWLIGRADRCKYTKPTKAPPVFVPAEMKSEPRRDDCHRAGRRSRAAFVGVDSRRAIGGVRASPRIAVDEGKKGAITLLSAQTSSRLVALNTPLPIRCGNCQWLRSTPAVPRRTDGRRLSRCHPPQSTCGGRE
jgi:hypothetical protein